GSRKPTFEGRGLRRLNFIQRPRLGIVQAFEELLECFREQVSPYCPCIARARHGLGVAHDEHIGLPHLLVDEAAPMLEEQLFPDTQDVSEEIYELDPFGFIQLRDANFAATCPKLSQRRI